MTTAPLRAARITGLLLGVLCAGSPAALAMGPPAAYHVAPAPAGVHVAAIGTPGPADGQCPCNAGLLRREGVGTRVSLCPCNAGMPDAAAVIGTRTVTVGELRSGGGRPQDLSARVRHAQATPVQRAVPASQGGGFDVADASVGAGVAVLLGLVLAGVARMLGRRRWHGELTAGSRR